VALPEDLVEALLRALRDDPRRLAALRALLLEGSGQEPPWDRLARTQEEMGAALRDLARAQVRTEANVAALAERVGQLAEAQRRTEERLEALTARVDQLAEAQRRTEERLEALTARVDQLAARVDDLTVRLEALTARVDDLTVRLEALTARVDQLAEAQRRTEERLEALTARVDDLTVRLEALTARVDQLAEAQRRTEERLEALTARVDSLAARVEDLTVQVGALTARVGGLVGESVERRYRERPFAYLWRIALGLEALPSRELDLLLREVGGPQGLTEEEEAEVRELDAVLKGSRRDDGREVVVAVEASARLDADDVARVLRRSAILARGPFPVVPVVAGEQAPPDVVELARRQGVWVAVDGRTLEPTGAGA